jgi:predicted enzyme involved in methoxymalonyl-ACP biosynthesis
MATSHLPNNLAKGTGTGLSAAILGSINAQTLTYAMWGGLEIIVNPYTKGKAGITEFIVNSYSDFAVLQPNAFVVVKDFDTAIS